MHIVGIVVWVASALYAIGWGFVIRQKAKNEQATEHAFETHALLLLVSVIIVPALSLSPFHLLWMVPASFVIGLASMMPPLSLLWIPASLYGSLWYIGTKNPGRAFYVAGDYAKAIECYKETIRSRPQSAEAHFNLGCAYDKIGDTKSAIESYKEVLRLSPHSAETYCNLGFDYKQSGDNQKAIESFKEAIRIRANYVKARWNLGKLFIEIGDMDNALKEYEVLRTLDQQHADELYSAIKAKEA
jgi:tetratricopeptide (TPR) repeat protein